MDRIDYKNENRKIPLDTSIFCPYNGTSSGGDENCKHDYPPKPTVESPSFAEWTCSKCGMRRTYQVWE